MDCTSLASVTIPDSVTIIGESAFERCSSLASVTIGNSVTSIGNSAFNSCTSLTAINVDSSNANYSSENGVLYNKAKTILIKYPQGKSGAFTIPNSVTSIEQYNFSNCTSLTGITIPDSVTSIGQRAFYNCTSLASVTIGSGVNDIYPYAFYYCTSLTSVTFQGTIPSNTFQGDNTFHGDLRAKFYATDTTNGTPGTYTTTAPVSNYSVWRKQD